MSTRSVLREYLNYLKNLLNIDPLAYGDLIPMGRESADLEEDITTPLLSEGHIVFPDSTWLPLEATWAKIKGDPAVQEAKALGFATTDLYAGDVAGHVVFFEWLIPRLKSTSVWLYAIGGAAGVAVIAGLFYSANR